MLEKDIKIELIKRELKPSDVYKALNLERGVKKYYVLVDSNG